ncbi:MAG: condensation domain-containing protein [Vicinamibacterales bacterium]
MPRPPLVRQPPRPHTPLALPQGRFWILNRLDGPRPNYTEWIGLRFKGAIDVAAVERAIQDVVERHESLRTVYPERDGLPSQVILEGADTHVPLVHRAIDASSFREYTRAESRRHFDLRVELPVRAQLLKLTPEDHVLLLALHHIAIDTWSVHRLIVPDLLKAYHARARGESPSLRPPALQFADWTMWQLQVLGDEGDADSEFGRQLAYWQHHLQGLPEQLPLPTDRPRPPVSTYEGASVPILIPRPLHDSILALGREQRASAFMIVQAAFAAVLTRLGAGTDIAIGVPVSCRMPRVNDVVGCFVNTMAVRIDTSGNPSFVELLKRVRHAVLSACAHADVPFERVVEAMNPPRLRSRNPLFQVLFGLQAVPAVAMPTLSDASVVRMPLRFGDHARFDLALDLVERRGPGGVGWGIRGTIQYSTDLFERPTIDRLLWRLITFLQAVTTAPTAPIEHVDLLEPAERRQLRRGWMGQSRRRDTAAWPERFQRVAREHPDRPAIVAGARSATYEVLNRDANRIAHHLQSSGVGAEQVVAVAVPSAIDRGTCLLAAAKAGAAFLLLDFEQPSSRLAAILHDAAPAVVLTTRAAARALPASAPLLILDTAEASAMLARYADSDPPERRPLMPDHAAYFAPGGSASGAAAAAIVTHRAVTNAVESLQAVHSIGADDRVFVGESGGDLAGLQMIRTWLAGAAAIMPGGDAMLYPEQFARAIVDSGLTVLQTTPSHAAALTDHLDTALANVRMEMTRERMRPQLAESLLSGSRSTFLNLFGATETGGWNTAGIVSQPQRAGCVGRPLENMRVYVLDSHLQIAPIGVPGDVYVAGAGLARGYLRRPGLTADRFVADPYGPAGSRMCRTGDTARWRHEGELEFLGREDEDSALCAVEEALIAAPGVREAVAVRHDADDDRRLTAYVTPRSGSSIDCDAVERYLTGTLAPRLAPEQLVVLERLPLTASGAIARHELPRPPEDDATEHEPSELELQFCELFAQVLGVSSVAPGDDFFRLGGHSLLVATLVDRARTTFGMNLEMSTVFDAPTAARLAACVTPSHVALRA